MKFTIFGDNLIKEYIDMEKDLLIQKAIQNIAHKEREILDDFAKAYLAHLSLEGKDLKKLFGRLILTQKIIRDPDGSVTHEYSYSLKKGRPNK
jgi:hypothetical protein